jgi:transposase
MSFHPRHLNEVPLHTAQVAHAAFPKGSIYMTMRDELGLLYDDAAFAALFPKRGQPAAPPWRLALILVMQFAEGLSDRQAADAVRARIDWKYALGLDLTDPGVDASVLSEFRSRLVAGGVEQVLLDAMLACFRDRGLLKAGGRQRTDSTHVLTVVRGLNRLECVGETLRHALNSLATAAPDWLRRRLDPTWIERYGPRLQDERLPQAGSARQELAEQIGADGVGLLTAVDAETTELGWLREVPAVQTLRRVWIQQYQLTAEGVLCWRQGADLPPAGQMINSPYDVDARYSTKRSTSWIGYKAHVTETCDPDRPHLITNVETTLGPTPDRAMTDPIQEDLAAKDLLPAEHDVDAGYVDGTTLVNSQRRGVDLVGPAPVDNHWQARAGHGFDAGSFALDWEQERATCPGGKTSTKWSDTHDGRGHPIINIRFARADCLACPHRSCCTTARDGPREITVRPRDQHLALQTARAREATPEFKAAYNARAGIEGTLSQALRVCEIRRARYVGLAKVHLEHILTAAALNLRRIAAWGDGTPLAQTRQPRFVTLAIAA